MTKEQAIEEITDMADEATNENYHTEAYAMYAAIEEIERLTERAIVLVPDMYGSFQRYEVEI